MLCEKCGAENPDGSAFCQKCGAPLAKSSAPKSKSEAKPKSRAKPKTPAVDTKVNTKVDTKGDAKKESKKTINVGGFSEMLDKLPVALILLIAAAVALLFALLSGLLMAIGSDDIFDNGSYAFGHFCDRLVMGILVAGVLVGLSVIISRK